MDQRGPKHHPFLSIVSGRHFLNGKSILAEFSLTRGEGTASPPGGKWLILFREFGRRK